jgi:hypothetical protein
VSNFYIQFTLIAARPDLEEFSGIARHVRPIFPCHKLGLPMFCFLPLACSSHKGFPTN